MALPASGAISLFDVNTELGLTRTAQMGLLCTNVRTLFGTASGAVGLQTGYGKSNTSVPGAPTIGTATATGSTTATVSFTAPANNGNATITSYTAVSSPGSITGTLSQSGSGTISVSGLSGGTSYTFTVYATNSVGNSSSSSASNSITTTPVVGQAYAGGYYAGQIMISCTKYNLVIAPRSTGLINFQGYGGSCSKGTIGQYNNTAYACGATSINNGAYNTNIINNKGNGTSSGAVGAWWVKSLTIGGYSDWYIPSNMEFNVIYRSFKPNSVANVTCNNTANPYAVSPQPVNTNFTSCNPAVTSVPLFRFCQSPPYNDSGYSTNTNYFRSESVTQYYVTGAPNCQAMVFQNYNWTSTLPSSSRGTRFSFQNGSSSLYYPNGGGLITAIRKVAA